MTTIHDTAHRGMRRNRPAGENPPRRRTVTGAVIQKESLFNRESHVGLKKKFLSLKPGGQKQNLWSGTEMIGVATRNQPVSAGEACMPRTTWQWVCGELEPLCLARLSESRRVGSP